LTSFKGTAATALVAALAFLKDPNDRNNNMQYLECLSAALQDMAYTYQPAERMSVVLRAVLVELRGGPPDTTSRLYKSKSSLVPARRGSTNDTQDVPMFKRRQTSRPRANTNSGKTQRSLSMSTTMTAGDLSIKPLPPRFDGETDRNDGFIMVTPHTEMPSWQLDPATLDPSLTAATPAAASLSSSAPQRNAWMGTSSDLDQSDPIVQLANVHFPELPAMDAAENMSHLDFMSLGDASTDWSREWVPSGGGVGVGSDLDGFPPQSGFNVGFGNERYSGMLTG
jgi:hypothetical protein